jgi:hypothetical protein
MGMLFISFGAFKPPTHSVDGDASYQFCSFKPPAHAVYGALFISFGALKSPAHPVNGGEVSSRNVGKSSHFEAAICQRKFHGIPRQCSVNYCLEVIRLKTTGRSFIKPLYVKIHYIKLFQSIQPL